MDEPEEVEADDATAETNPREESYIVTTSPEVAVGLEAAQKGLKS